MKKTISAFCISATLIGNNLKAQVTPVDPSTFAGHYFTEVKMVIESGYSKKKKDELDFTFESNETAGLLKGVVKGFEDNSNKIVFYADNYNTKWAKETGIWFFANNNMNGTYYGKAMFDYNEMSMGTFIEPGLFVVFAAYSSEDKSKAFMVKMDVNRIRLIAKDQSKLTMDKLVAAQKAEDMINAAAGAQLKKIQNDQEKAAIAVPNESLSKTDKELKKEITTLLKGFMSPEDTDAEFICAYTTSNDWTIFTNKLTGMILNREINAEMILKNKKSGKCWRSPYTLVAQYNGAGYGKLAFKKKWNMMQCDCAQVDKNK
jgi:hypothetical protein